MCAHRLFITGTDTGIGKTLLSLLFMKRLFALNKNPFYFKPFQTGCLNEWDRDSDARFIYEHTLKLKDKDPVESMAYCFKAPKAPLFAARDEGKTIEIERVHQQLKTIEARSEVVIIEGAGGLMVPITQTFEMTDLIKETGATPILAARAGLGTINHTLLSLDHLETLNISCGGVVLIDSGDAETEPSMIRENIEAIEAKSGILVSGVIPKLKDFTDESLKPLHHLIDPLIRPITGN